MPRETVEFDAIEDARDFAAGDGIFLVLEAETLRQIEDVEAQGASRAG